MPRPKKIIIQAIDDDDALAAAQTLSGGGIQSVTLESGVSGAQFPTPHQVIITSSGDDSNITFTVTGTNQAGLPLSETIDGESAGVAATTKYFGSITSVVASDDTDGNIKVGLDGRAGYIVPCDRSATSALLPTATAQFKTLSGSVTYNVYGTNNNVQDINEDIDFIQIMTDEINDETNDSIFGILNLFQAVMFATASGSNGTLQIDYVQSNRGYL